MLRKKLLREMRHNWAQFLSIFLLAFLAMALYCCMEGHVLAQHSARAEFHKECNLADLWIYGEGFSEENLESVRNLDFVKDAGLRMAVTGSAPECDGAQVDLYLEREDIVNQPYYMEGEKFDPSDKEGLWLTAAFAKVRNIKVGDDFTISYEAKVGYIFRSMETQGIAFLREDFEKTGAEYTPTTAYSNEDLSGYEKESYVTAVHSKEDMIQVLETSYEVISIMVWMMVIFSVILIVVVLYNSGNLSFHERMGEFATLKVLGLQTSRIRNILTVQNLWLSVIGIIIGAPFGKMSLNAMMNSNGENFDYAFTVTPGCYLISGVLVLAVSMAVSFLFSRRIRNLDMVEILKGVE